MRLLGVLVLMLLAVSCGSNSFVGAPQGDAGSDFDGGRGDGGLLNGSTPDAAVTGGGRDAGFDGGTRLTLGSPSKPLSPSNTLRGVAASFCEDRRLRSIGTRVWR